MASLRNVRNEIVELKYHEDDVIASLHAKDNRYLAGMLHVLRKINLIIEFPDMLDTTKKDKSVIEYAIYCLAYNLKRYDSDLIIREGKRSDFESFYSLWRSDYKRFMTVADLNLHKEFMENIGGIDNIIRRMKDWITVNPKNFKFRLDDKEKTFLNILANN